MTVVKVPRGMVAKKPPHGSPCNNCGLCCWTKKCDIGRALFGSSDGRCPALCFDGKNESYCDVVRNTSLYTTHAPDEARAAALLLLFAGHGCTMRINGEMNSDFNNKLDDFERSHRSEFDHACDIWGVKTPKRF